MAILIDMEMPRNCMECKFERIMNYDMWCHLNKTYINECGENSRLPDCPLLEVPEVIYCKDCKYAADNQGKLWICNHPTNNTGNIDEKFRCLRGIVYTKCDPCRWQDKVQ